MAKKESMFAEDTATFITKEDIEAAYAEDAAEEVEELSPAEKAEQERIKKIQDSMFKEESQDDEEEEEGGDSNEDSEEDDEEEQEEEENEEEEEEDEDSEDSEDKDEDEEEEEEENEKDKKKSKVKPNAFLTLSFFKESDTYLTEEEKAKLDFDENNAEEVLENTLDNLIESTLKNSIKDLPDGIKQVVELAAKGEDYQDIIVELASKSKKGLSLGMKIEDEEKAEQTLRALLQEEELAEDEIDDMVELFRDKETLLTKTQERYNKWSTKEKARLDKITKDREKANKLAIKAEQDTIAKARKVIAKGIDKNGIKITEKDKSIADFAFKRNVQLKSGHTVSELDIKLAEMKRAEDPTDYLVLSKLINDGFDFSSLVNKARTKEKDKKREDIQRTTKSKKGGKKGPINHIVDLF